MTIREELDNLKISITNLSDAAENCDIVQVNRHSELIGDSIRSLDHGRDVMFSDNKEERQVQVREYQLLIKQYEIAKDKLFRCDCSKKV